MPETRSTSVASLIEDARSRLRGLEPNAGPCARRLWAHAVGKDVTEVIPWQEELPLPGVLSHFEDLVARMEAGEPEEYVVGAAFFRGRRFEVGPGVLIPRPETEGLVDLTVSCVRSRGYETILDLGTGSGCVAISLKLELPACTVTAVDVSRTALAFARRNAKIHGVAAAFIESSFYAEVDGQYDVIVANPPYISPSEYEVLDHRVKDYEPREALWSDDSGLGHTRIVARDGFDRLNQGGMLALEVDSRRGPETAELVRKIGYMDITIGRDLYDRTRFVSGVRP